MNNGYAIASASDFPGGLLACLVICRRGLLIERRADTACPSAIFWYLN